MWGKPHLWAMWANEWRVPEFWECTLMGKLGLDGTPFRPMMSTRPISPFSRFSIAGIFQRECPRQTPWFLGEDLRPLFYDTLGY